MKSVAKWTALVVDDTEEARRLLAEQLAAADFRVTQARDAFDALERLAEEEPDLLVTDLRMPGQEVTRVSLSLPTRLPLFIQ